MTLKHRLLLITTGGTLMGHVASDKLDEVMLRRADKILGFLGSTVGYLNRRLDIDLDVDSLEVCDKDSSDLGTREWIDLARIIKEKYDEYDAFVVIHGTNTMGYTAAALSFALPNPGKPIVITGSQVSAGLPGSDALTNLENAIRVAVWRRQHDGPPIRGVLAVFGSQIITGTRVKKANEFDYDAFAPYASHSVGRIGRIINIDDSQLMKHTSYQKSNLWQPAATAGALLCENSFDMRVASLTEFPGMCADVFDVMVDRHDVKGFVLRAFGAGDPSSAHLEALRRLRSFGIPIVITTQAPNGMANMQVNASGQSLRDEGLAIPAHDMSIEAITTKLGWLLALKAKRALTYEQLCEQMQADLRGEINVLWEVG